MKLVVVRQHTGEYGQVQNDDVILEDRKLLTSLQLVHRYIPIAVWEIFRDETNRYILSLKTP